MESETKPTSAGKAIEKPDHKHSRFMAAFLKYRDPPGGEQAVQSSDLSERPADELEDQSSVGFERAQSFGSVSGTARADDARRTWFNRLSGVYTVAERQIARGAKALQSLAVPGGRLHNYQDAKDRLEEAAARLRGPDRAAAVRRWINVMTAPEQSNSPHPVIVAQPASPADGGREEEEDWQQLSTLPVQSGSAPGVEKSSVSRIGSAAMFVDHSSGISEPMTFRELFLRSNALESIIAGYAEEAPASQEEEELLSQLVGVCFGPGCSEGQDNLLGDLLALSGAHSQCQQSSVPEPQMLAIRDIICQAISGLKQKASVEILDRKMTLLREDVAEQAATAALLHKFNSGANEPTGEVTHQRLLQGLAATKEVMLLVEALCKLAETRSTLVVEAAPPDHPALLDSLDQRSSRLHLAIASSDTDLDENLSQQRESENFRERKLKEMDGSVQEIQEEIQGLQTERAKLLAQLEKVELALTKAQARRADLEEGRNVFEEGNNFTIEALRHQAGELSGLQGQYEAEVAAITKCHQLVCRAQSAQHQVRQEELAKAADTVVSVAQEYSHAATRHLYFQRAQLQLVLRQLNYCASELAGLEDKQKHISRLGMERLMPDIAVQQRRLMHQYLDAEASQTAHLDQVAGVREKVQAVGLEASTALSAVHGHSAAGKTAEMPASKELEDLFESLEALASDLRALKRPEGLPPIGEKIQEPQEIGRKTSEQLDKETSKDPIVATSREGTPASSGFTPDSLIQSSVGGSSGGSLSGLQVPVREMQAGLDQSGFQSQPSDPDLEKLLGEPKSAALGRDARKGEQDPLSAAKAEQEADSAAEGL